MDTTVTPGPLEFESHQALWCFGPRVTRLALNLFVFICLGPVLPYLSLSTLLIHLGLAHLPRTVFGPSLFCPSKESLYLVLLLSWSKAFQGVPQHSPLAPPPRLSKQSFIAIDLTWTWMSHSSLSSTSTWAHTTWEDPPSFLRHSRANCVHAHLKQLVRNGMSVACCFPLQERLIPLLCLVPHSSLHH